MEKSSAMPRSAPSKNSPAGEPVLDVRDLRVAFKVEAGTLKAVDGLSLSLRPGEVLGIVGESGSGKSVSMLSLAGLIKAEKRETTGTARFLGKDLLDMGMDELSKVRGRQMGFVFQNPMSSLNPTMKIGPQIAEGMLHHGVAKRSDVKDKVVALLDKVGIREPAKRYSAYPHELSGGMRQRVMIAMALSCEPKLLIADEPTTALDVTVEKQILELMMKMKEEMGLSIIMITHNLPVALNYCDRILVMYAGKVMETGTALQLVTQPAHPYTAALFNSNLDIGKRGTRVEPIKGNIPPLTQLPTGCRFHPRCPAATDKCRAEAPDLDALSGAAGPEGAHLAACHYPTTATAAVLTPASTAAASAATASPSAKGAKP
jgi:peptide/nickel transport system ATP-binding protein/oligopeptide transport system ATP-binding protein